MTTEVVGVRLHRGLHRGLIVAVVVLLGIACLAGFVVRPALTGGVDGARTAEPSVADDKAGAGGAAGFGGAGDSGQVTAAPSGPAYPHGRPRSFTLVAGGDVLIHGSLARQAQRDGGGRSYAFDPMLAGITPWVRGADVAICHLEVPLAAPGAPLRSYPRFSAPPQVAGALRHQGWDLCTTASNHALDQGAAGVATTLSALESVGLAASGTARTAAEALRPRLLHVRVAGGVRLASLAYTYGFNGMPRAARHLANAIGDGGVPAILQAARRARQAGAEVVVVSLHAGREYDHRPTPQQRQLARRLLASPLVDLVVGHHAHVVQPAERIAGKWVTYGLGNMIAARSHRFAGGATHEGVLPRFTFVERSPGRFTVASVEAAATYVDIRGAVRVRLTRADPASSRAAQALARTRRVLQKYAAPLAVH